MNKKLTHLFFYLFLGLAGSVQAWNAPNISSPANNALVFTGVTLDWTAVASSQNYQLQLDTTPSFNSPILFNLVETYINSNSSNSDTREFVEDLYFGQTYYWRVRAYIPNDTSAWVQRSFTTRDDVNLDGPSNNSLGFTGNTFDWFSHWGVDYYDLELDTSMAFNSPALRQHAESYINTNSSNTDTEQFITDLYFGQTYYWRVRARNAVDTSAWSIVYTYHTRDDVGLDSPNDNSLGYTGNTFDWFSHWGVDYYDLELDTSMAFNSPALRSHTETYINTNSSNTDTEQFISDLYFGQTYYWRVRARNGVDTSAWSLVYTYNTRDDVGLDSPSDNSLGYTGNTFDWYSHWGVDFYDLELDTSMAFNSPALRQHSESYINTNSSNTDTEQFISDLYFGKTYYWRVRARNAVDTSAWSTVYIYNTRDDVGLDSPSDNSTGYTGNTFDWYSHWGVDFYDLELDTSMAFNSPALRSHTESYINTNSSNTDTEQFISDLYFGKTYYWRVRARNAVDTSAWSTVYIYNTRDDVGLDSPSDNSTGYTGNTFDWYSHWGVDFYDLELDTSMAFNSPALRSHTESYINTNSSNTDTEQFISDLYFGKTYYWRIRARNAVDTSAWSVVYTYHTRDDVGLDSPVDGNSWYAGNTFDWFSHWGVDFYDLELDTSMAFNSPALRSHTESYINTNSSNTDTEQFISDLYFGKTYYWRVRARNAVDTSAWSVVRSYNTFDHVTLSSPSNGSSSISVSGTTLNWASHWGVDFYQMELDSTPQFNSSGLAQNTTAYINTNSSNSDTRYVTGALAASTVYYWRVRAINAVDTTAWTTWVFSTGVPIQVPDVPVHVSPSNGAVNVGVSPSLDWNNANNATGYEYQYATNAAFSGAIAGTSTNSNSPNLSLATATTYYWRVRSLNNNVFSVWSNPWSFNTGCNLAAPVLSGSTICEGESVLLSSSGGATYNYYDQEIGGQPLSSGTSFNYGPLFQTDTLYISAFSGNCESPRTMVIITVSAAPAMPAISQIGADSLTAGASAVSYQWFFNGSPLPQTGQTIFANQSGNYQVVAYNGDGCPSDTSSAFPFVFISVEDALPIAVDLFPNPNRGEFQVKLPESLHPWRLSIVDLSGRTVWKKEVEMGMGMEQTMQVELSNLAAGTYFLRFQTGERTGMRRLLIQ